MSWNVSASGKREDVSKALEQQLGDNPHADAVKQVVNQALGAFGQRDENFILTTSGHVAEDGSGSFSVNVQSS